MISDNKSIQQLAAVLLQKGIVDIVISPGSRNAPVINTFAGSKEFVSYSVVDERSAAFFALGLALKKNKPVALSCTSGSAALNYAPAVAEAYYQKIPLIVITADRPVEYTDQGDGQTIRQRNLYGHHVRKSVELPQHINNDDDLWHTNRLINQAVNASKFPVPGPVHINIPFLEPLYNVTDSPLPKARTITDIASGSLMDDITLQAISNLINSSKKTMLLAGQEKKNGLEALLDKIAALPNMVLLSESTSNLKNANGISCIDKVLATIGENDEESFAPDVLITFGEAIVSKRIKAFLRRNSIANHLHISTHPTHPDTYKCLTQSVYMDPLAFFKQVLPTIETISSDYHKFWLGHLELAESRHERFLKQAGYSDLKVFENIFHLLPKTADLHLGNSSPVRYAQLFRHQDGVEHFCNRGTSGIDGCTSTAIGTAWASQKLTVLITGDLAFYYDSNGLWNSYLSKKLRIIVINNGGGNIFRIIPGPSSTEHLEQFYETRHLENTEGFAKTFGLEYFHACSLEELNQNLTTFLNEDLNKPAILEIFTHRKKSPEILKNYFNYLKDENPDFLLIQK